MRAPITGRVSTLFLTRLSVLLRLCLMAGGCTPGGGASSTLQGPAGPLPVQRTAAGIPLVRVRLLEGQTAVRLAATGNPTLRLTSSNAPVLLNIGTRPITISTVTQGWNLGGW